MILKTIYDVDQNELKSFSCGNKDLDRFLTRHAFVNDQNGYGKTFILVDNEKILGFFTLCSSSIQCEEYPAFNSHLFPRYPIPCIRIARLAVKKEFQGKGIGKELLKQAFIRIVNVASTVGVRLVVVDAKESSKSFYEKYGFMRLKEDKLTYYLLIDTLIEAIK